LGTRPSAKEEIKRAQFAQDFSLSPEEDDVDDELLPLENPPRRLFTGTEYALALVRPPRRLFTGIE
jgi:hypothetical protein